MKIIMFVLCLAICNANGLPTKEALEDDLEDTTEKSVLTPIEDFVLFESRSGDIYNRSEGTEEGNLACLNADSLGYAMAFKLRIKNMEI